MPRPRRPRFAVQAAIFAALLLGATLVASPAHVRAWDAGTFSASDEVLLVNLTNQARAAAGLGSLRVSSALRSLAEWRSKDMVERNYFAHEIPPEGNLVFHYMDERGIAYQLAGENIGWDNAPDDQATAVVQQMFMDSPLHRANILNAKWDSIGVGAFKSSDGVMKFTILFMQRAPAHS
jgi:uncharacterized protein YkwD